MVVMMRIGVMMMVVMMLMVIMVITMLIIMIKLDDCDGDDNRYVDASRYKS